MIEILNLLASLILILVICIFLLFFNKSFIFKRISFYFFGLSSLIAILNHYYSIFSPLPDADSFHYLSTKFIENTFYGGSTYINQSVGAMFFVKFFVVPIYLVFGNNPLNVILINNFLITLVFIMIVKVSEYIALYFNDSDLSLRRKSRIELLSFGLVFFYPSLFMYRMFLLRDPLIIFAIILFIYSLLLIFTMKINKKSITFFIVSILLIGFIRPQNVPILIICIIIYTVFFWKIKIVPKLGIILFIFAMVFLFSETQVFRFINLINPSYLMSYRYSQVIQFNSYLSDINYYSWFEVIKYIPQTSFYYLLTPFFWEPASYRYLIPSIDSLFNFSIFILLIFSLKAQNRNSNKIKKYISFLVIFSLVSFVSYSVVEVYMGGAVRHRMQQIILLLPIVIGWLSSRKGKD